MQYRQLQTAAVHFQFCFLQVARLLLKLNLGLDHVRVRDLAALFELLADIEKALTLGGGALGRFILPLRHDEMVVGLYDGHDQAAGGNLGAGPRHCFRGPRAPVVGDPLQGNVLVNIALAEVFVHSVGANESPGGCAIALGVEKSGVVVHAGQQGRRGLVPGLLSRNRKRSARRGTQDLFFRARAMASCKVMVSGAEFVD